MLCLEAESFGAIISNFPTTHAAHYAEEFTSRLNETHDGALTDVETNKEALEQICNAVFSTRKSGGRKSSKSETAVQTGALQACISQGLSRGNAPKDINYTSTKTGGEKRVVDKVVPATAATTGQVDSTLVTLLNAPAAKNDKDKEKAASGLRGRLSQRIASNDTAFRNSSKPGAADATERKLTELQKSIDGISRLLQECYRRLSQQIAADTTQAIMDAARICGKQFDEKSTPDIIKPIEVETSIPSCSSTSAHGALQESLTLDCSKREDEEQLRNNVGDASPAGCRGSGTKKVNVADGSVEADISLHTNKIPVPVWELPVVRQDSFNYSKLEA